MKKNFKNILSLFTALLVGALLLNSCEKIDSNKPDTPKPINWTMAVVNEGWFGHEGGSINIYDKENNSWIEKAYQTANPGKQFGNTSTVGVQNGNKIYFVSKETPHLIEAESKSMKHLSELNLPTKGEQAMNFAAVDEKRAYLTTSFGLYEISLNPVVLGKKIAEGSCEDIFYTDGKLYYICDKTAYFYDVSAANVNPIEIGPAKMGFVKAGAYLWAADEENLLKIDMKAGSMEKIAAGCKLSWNEWAYTPNQLCADKDGKNIFFTSGKKIKKFNLETKTASDLYTLTDRDFYGARMSIHPEKDILYLTTIVGWTNQTFIELIDCNTGKQLQELPYTTAEESNNYWFPSQVIFIQD